jgi:hypothetical protein|tara:strand:- start:6812 stop:7021 length:210 start_codon:yes stop_codon:yes gene_type:complete
MISKFVDEVTAQIMTGLEYDKRRDPIKYTLEENIVRRILMRNLDSLLEEIQGVQKDTSGDNQESSLNTK